MINYECIQLFVLNIYSSISIFFPFLNEALTHKFEKPVLQDNWYFNETIIVF